MVRRRFKLIEHTADTGIVAYGDNLPEAFASAAYGMFSIITDLRKVRRVEQKSITVSADDIEGLLFEWLNSLLYVFDVEHLLFSKFDINKFDEKNLGAICRGEKYDPSRHQLKLGVKSATYHMLKIDPKKNTVQVIFDI